MYAGVRGVLHAVARTVARLFEQWSARLRVRLRGCLYSGPRGCVYSCAVACTGGPRGCVYGCAVACTVACTVARFLVQLHARLLVRLQGCVYSQAVGIWTCTSMCLRNSKFFFCYLVKSLLSM